MTSVCLLIIIIHFFTCRYFMSIMKKNHNTLMLHMLPLVSTIPLFGILSYEIVRRVVALENDRQSQLDQLKEVYGDDDLKRPISCNQDAPDQMIPFEEAILMNNEVVRRKLMLCILRQEPTKFLELLKIARFDTDVEVTHYATTTIMEIQRKYDLMLARVHDKYLVTPEDDQNIEKYIEILQEYIECGLLNGYLLQQQSLRLQELLKRKLLKDPSNQDSLEALARSYLAGKDYKNADIITRELCARWPHEESVWILAVGVCMESRNRQRKAEIQILMSRTPIRWTSKGREFMKYIYGDNFLENHNVGGAEDGMEKSLNTMQLVVAASGYGR